MLLALVNVGARLERVVLVGVVALAAVNAAPTSETYSFDFSRPTATALNQAGDRLYVLDGNAAVVDVVRMGPPPELEAAFGGAGSGDGQLHMPADLVRDTHGNVVVVDTGNFRLTVFSAAGSFLQNVPLGEERLPESIAVAQDGGLAVLCWNGEQARFEIVTLGDDYRARGSFPVDVSCPSRSAKAMSGVLVADGDGALWVLDLAGCDDDYTLRKYTTDGSPLGSYNHQAGQIPLDAQRGKIVRIVSDLFIADSSVYVILGAGGAETGGLDVDVWSLSGTYGHRARVVGPARPLVHATVGNGKVYLTDELGMKAVIAVSLAAL